MPDPAGRISVEAAAAVLRRTLAAGLPVEPAVLVHDLDRMRARLGALAAAFPPDALHALAIKANPLVAVLRAAVQAGAGLEAASLEEVFLARAAGCPAPRIALDSPAKRPEDLADVLPAGNLINADSFEELARIAALIPAGRRGGVGLRINPQAGDGGIRTTSVAGPRSRFGVPLDQADRILAAFARYPWLDGLHVHVGSQGCPLDLLVEGVRRVDGLRQQIEAALGPGRVRTFDLGGGLPVAYRAHDTPPSLDAYVSALHAAAPGLFAEGPGRRPRLVTELGRWVQAGSGWAASRVEYVKEVAGRRVAVLHLGADLLLRRAYRPEDWHHEFAVLDAQGHPRPAGAAAAEPVSLVGPLCFAGDVLAEGVALPPPEPGDWVLIRDAGAYTLSMWSRHCSRGMPLVLGVDGEELPVLRPRETPEDIVRFWGDGWTGPEAG